MSLVTFTRGPGDVPPAPLEPPLTPSPQYATISLSFAGTCPLAKWSSRIQADIHATPPPSFSLSLSLARSLSHVPDAMRHTRQTTTRGRSSPHVLEAQRRDDGALPLPVRSILLRAHSCDSSHQIRTRRPSEPSTGRSSFAFLLANSTSCSKVTKVASSSSDTHLLRSSS